jgi:hypothetical protein
MKRLGVSLKLTIGSALACALAMLASQRGQAEAPSDQFQSSADTVADTKTGLIWQKNVAMSEATFEEVQTYCANLTLDGATDWRVPSIKELQTLVADERKMSAYVAEETAFPPLDGNKFQFLMWSSTPLAGLQDNAWFVDFRGGVALNIDTAREYAVRCVR